MTDTKTGPEKCPGSYNHEHRWLWYGLWNRHMRGECIFCPATWLRVWAGG